MARVTTTTEWLRHDFSEAERLLMGAELADAHNRLASIEEEESVVKAKFKERKVSIEQKVGSLSRELGLGYTMQNVTCRVDYDTPNLNEVSIVREDTGAVVRVRAMTADERQAQIKFDTPIAVNPDKVEEVIAESAENVAEFFGEHDTTAPDQPLPIEEPQLEAVDEPQPEPTSKCNCGGPGKDPEWHEDTCPESLHQKLAEEKATRRANKTTRAPRGFAGPTNPSAMRD